MNSNAATVFSQTACRLGEGPTYDPATDTLFWFSITEMKLLEKNVSDETERVHDLPHMASALAVIDAERQLVVTETGLHVRDTKSGKLTLHMPVEADNPATRSNDSRVHPSGALWFGTMGKNEEKHAGAIYWFFMGEVRKLFADVTIPNSICFSPDAKTAYYTDTPTGILFRVDCDAQNGLPIGEPKVFHDHRGIKGFLDGSVVDADGVLWNACWDAGCVNVYAPDGKHVRSIAVPASKATCPAFMGKNADRIAVTSAWQGYDSAQRASNPEAGKTFLLDVPVKGRFEPSVRL
jgi:sugar lactone lactonase YvrE